VIDRRALLKDLQREVRALEKDLVEQIGNSGEHYAKLRPEYDRAFDLKRTAATWPAWRDERVTQTAVAWVLGSVFVRFCEDNGLFGDACFLTGQDKDRAVLAEESQEDFFRQDDQHRGKTDRDWLLAAFDHIGRTQAGRLLFDTEHNPAYRIPISHDAAKALIGFWRRRDPAGALVHDFTDPDWDTRFLGDLYQELSETARKKYALLQTPDFVEEFILDLTLKPAIDEFGHETIKAIDPTCGSGHFLLGIFRRLMDEWKKNDPDETGDRHEMVRMALESVHGVDLNPFAVAIARFRLLLAAMREAGFTNFQQTRQYAFPIQIAIGDSLIKKHQGTLFEDVDEVDELATFRYSTEDLDNFPNILTGGRYHVVVGNPPYVTPADKKLAKRYKDDYPDVCIGSFALSVPFAQCFFELAKKSEADGRGAGHVGQITANSFMKREFGEALIKHYFSKVVDLTHVIDTSGAYIPGHGTPTVILAGRADTAKQSNLIKAVRSVRGEPGKPSEPAEGLVWTAIQKQIGQPGSRSEWVTVENLDRRRYIERFPWVLQDGGLEILEILEGKQKLRDRVTRIGFFGDSHADEVFTLPKTGPLAAASDTLHAVPGNKGDHIRDWVTVDEDLLVFPYTSSKNLLPEKDLSDNLKKYLWPFRTELGNRSSGNKTYFQSKRDWWQWHQLPKDAGGHAWALRFAFVATHFHLTLDRAGHASSRTAPIIRLPKTATEDDHLQLLGILNSSTACFWLKQVSHDKGIRGEGGGFTSDDWERFYEFTGTKLQEFPMPNRFPAHLAQKLDSATQGLDAVSPRAIATKAVPTRERVSSAENDWKSIRGRMIALQEELDWQVYNQFLLLPDDLTAPADDVPELQLGERAFEIFLARSIAAGSADTQWFERHDSQPITELPSHWPAGYRAAVEKRISAIEQSRYLALIERPEYKRRWAIESWDRMLARALRDWLLNRCEARELWYVSDESGIPHPRPLTIAQLSDELSQDSDFLAVAHLYDAGKELSSLLTELIESEHVPYLSALRHTEGGMEKRIGWEKVWDLQRQEDAAPDDRAKQAIRTRTPVPEKYKPGDFRKKSFWGNRGKLDVPRERFISYPQAGRDNDPSLLIGWAGWDHSEQAQALAELIVQRDEQAGWPVEKLVPLLAGLREIMPWVKQWHGEIDPETGESPATEYDSFLAERLSTHGLTEGDLAAWRPTPAARGRRQA